MSLLRLYRAPGLTAAGRHSLLQTARQQISPDIQGIDSEYCFNVDAATGLTAHQLVVLAWLLRETFEPEQFGLESFLGSDGVVLEVGPRMSFSTAWSTNAVSVCHACGSGRGCRRIERSRRFSADDSTAVRCPESSGPAFLWSGARPHDGVPVPGAAGVLRRRASNAEPG